MTMELHCNSAAPLTRWLVRKGLPPTPFVLVDVGVQGGVNPRWEPLADRIEVYGFDPLEEAIAPLKALGNPHHHYFAMALGNEDGERTLHVQVNRYASSLYAQAESRYQVDEKVWQKDAARRISIRKLDSLFAEGALPPADFIKLDCEGFEPDVLRGASRYLDASDLIGADLETNFNVSPTLPDTHFWASYEPLLGKRLLLFDVAFNRVPRARYAGEVAKRRSAVEAPGRFRPATWNVLLARDLIQDCESPSSYPRMPNVLVDADAVLKSIIVLELYGLIDWAYDYLRSFSDLLRPHLDVELARQVLVSAGTPHRFPSVMRRLLGWRRWGQPR
jgi:FkbM family methyltransferase